MEQFVITLASMIYGLIAEIFALAGPRRRPMTQERAREILKWRN